MRCEHTHGDTVLGIWICGECWAKLDAQPKRYGEVPMPYTRDEDFIPDTPRTRQGIVWQAETITSEDGFTLSQYLNAMIDRYIERCSEISRHDALDCALCFMRDGEVPFGDPEQAWDDGAAADAADEDMSYWDHDEGASGNS